MSDFRSYVMSVAEITHSAAYISFSAEEDAEVATIYSDDETSVLFLTDRMPWGDMLQEFKTHVLH